MPKKLRYYKLVKRIDPTFFLFCDLMLANNKIDAKKMAENRGWNTKTHQVEATTSEEMRLLLHHFLVERGDIVTKMSNILRYLDFG